MSDLGNFRKQRKQALETLDINWARRVLMADSGVEFSDQSLLVALHKTRYEVTDVDDKYRHESREWLERNHHTRYHNFPWPRRGQLPC